MPQRQSIGELLADVRIEAEHTGSLQDGNQGSYVDVAKKLKATVDSMPAVEGEGEVNRD